MRQKMRLKDPITGRTRFKIHCGNGLSTGRDPPVDFSREDVSVLFTWLDGAEVSHVDMP
jgi:hypothetical protein